jgi:transcription initiation factor IIE alpha subunit
LNQRSEKKIQNAAKFLFLFRRILSPSIQSFIRPYLDEPYLLALAIIDCFTDDRTLTIEEISQTTNLNKSTIYQVLNALRNGGMRFVVSRDRSWQVVGLTENATAIESLPTSQNT